MIRISPNRLRVLGAILDAKPRLLTIADLSLKFGFKSNHAAEYMLAALKADGMVTWEPGKARTLRATCRWIPGDEL